MPKYGSNIPQAREELVDLAKELYDKGQLDLSLRISAIVDKYLFRNPPDKVTRAKHNSPTAAQEREVLRLRSGNSDLSQQEIAQRVGLNPGRVSEILHKHR